MLTETFIRETGRMIRLLEKESINTIMELSMMVNG